MNDTETELLRRWLPKPGDARLTDNTLAIWWEAASDTESSKIPGFRAGKMVRELISEIARLRAANAKLLAVAKAAKGVSDSMCEFPDYQEAWCESIDAFDAALADATPLMEDAK